MIPKAHPAVACRAVKYRLVGTMVLLQLRRVVCLNCVPVYINLIPLCCQIKVLSMKFSEFYREIEADGWYIKTVKKHMLAASGRQCGRQLSVDLTTLESFALRENVSENRQFDSVISKKNNKARPAKPLEQESIIVA